MLQLCQKVMKEAATLTVRCGAEWEAYWSRKYAEEGAPGAIKRVKAMAEMAADCHPMHFQMQARPAAAQLSGPAQHPSTRARPLTTARSP